jgi:hypothetical protein
MSLNFEFGIFVIFYRSGYTFYTNIYIVINHRYKKKLFKLNEYDTNTYTHMYQLVYI